MEGAHAAEKNLEGCEIIDFDLASPVDPAVVDRIAACPWNAGVHLAFELRDGGHFSAGDRLVVAIVDGEIQAFAALAAAGAILGDARGPWVGFVYCWPEARGHGLTKAVVSRSCELAHEAENGSVFVASARDSLGLYRACGFEEREAAQAPWGEEIVVCERTL